VQVNGEDVLSLRVIEAVEDVAYELAGVGFGANANRIGRSRPGLDGGYQSLFLLCAASLRGAISMWAHLERISTALMGGAIP
jgi:hypothetical protein